MRKLLAEGPNFQGRGPLVVLMLTAALLALLPFYTNGFWMDDALNSQVRAMLQRFDESVIDFSMRVTSAWAHGPGRLTLGWINIYSMFYVLHELAWARAFSIAMLLCNIALFAAVLARLRVGFSFICLACLVLVSLFQIRGNHDPIAAYAGLYQTLGIQLMAGFWLLLRWRETQRAALLVGSSLVVFWSLTYYELNVVYYPLALLVVWRHAQQRARSLAIVLAPLAVFCAAAWWLRAHAATPYNGTSVGELGNFLLTFLRQLHSTLPGSFYSMTAQGELAPAQVLSAAMQSPVSWTLLALGCVLAYVLMPRGEREAPDALIWPLAGTLLILPAAIISVSARYQGEIGWGLGYLPVYYQYFGLSILITAAALSMARWWPSRCALAFVFGAYLALNFQVNQTMKERIDAGARQPRESLEQALRSGMLAQARDGDVVELPGAPIFVNGNLIFAVTGKRVFVPDEPATAGWFTAWKRPDARRFVVRREGVGWRAEAGEAAKNPSNAIPAPL